MLGAGIPGRKGKMLHKSLVALTICVMLLAGLAPASTAVASTDVGKPALGSVRDFARCVVNDIKMTPQAKKLTPKGYQELEKALNSAFNGTKYEKLGPYAAAVMTGAKIGKFIGYDLVWYMGAVQDCWWLLKRK
jgi:hypothetical protein